MTITSIKDYSILSLSAKRAGKRTIEGAAYYSMGVLYDNLGKYTKAIEQYSKFLHVCESTEDALGQALAYNYLGLDSMVLACASQKGEDLHDKQCVGGTIAHKAVIERVRGWDVCSLRRRAVL